MVYIFFYHKMSACQQCHCISLTWNVSRENFVWRKWSRHQGKLSLALQHLSVIQLLDLEKGVSSLVDAFHSTDQDEAGDEYWRISTKK